MSTLTDLFTTYASYISRALLTSLPRTTRRLTPSADARAPTARASLLTVGNSSTSSLMPVASGTVQQCQHHQVVPWLHTQLDNSRPDRTSRAPAPCQEGAPFVAPIPGSPTRPCARPLHRRSNASPTPRASSAQRHLGFTGIPHKLATTALSSPHP